jgi:ribose-phosphate pyrophosphokinase
MMKNSPAVLLGSACERLGHELCGRLNVPPGGYECRHFPDGEMQIELTEPVDGRDVFILQSTSPPVERHLLELLLLADACRRAGAGRVTVCIPYFGYARQDRRTGLSSLGTQVVARLLSSARIDRLLLIDAHTPAIEGFFDVPVDHLSAVPLLARAAAQDGSISIVVSPDLGAVRLAREYARVLNVPVGVVHKVRVTGSQVEARGVIGEVRGRRVLIVDDILSTAATVEAAVGVLRDAGVVEPISLAVSHALLVGQAREVLAGLPLARILATDSVAIPDPLLPNMQRVSIAPLIASAVERLASKRQN